MPKKIPQRMCIGCQEMKSKREMIRIVRTPTGEVILDRTGKKSGRGAYLWLNEQCLTKAVKEKKLEKALATAIDSQIYDEIRAEISK